jgi:hypothetical protein
MGRQVALYLHPDDHPSLQAWLDERGLLVFPSSVACAPIRAVPAIAAAQDDTDDDGLVICSKHDAGTFHCCYNARFQSFRIDPRASPVVEFDRSILEADVLWSGRFWFVPREYPPDFVKWADALLRWVRRSFAPTDHGYASPAAIRWRDATGGRFEQGPRRLARHGTEPGPRRSA